MRMKARAFGTTLFALSTLSANAWADRVLVFPFHEGAPKPRGAVVDEVIGVPGDRGTSSEMVAERACKLAQTFLAADVPVGEFLADQLLLPLALARGGSFRTIEPSLHTRTNAQVIERFLPVQFAMRDEGKGAWRIDVATK